MLLPMTAIANTPFSIAPDTEFSTTIIQGKSLTAYSKAYGSQKPPTQQRAEICGLGPEKQKHVIALSLPF